MACPLYKSLKQNGTSFYAFPGAAEDISAAYQNSNYKMYFSKYILLNIPKQSVSSSTTSPVYLDFNNSSQRGFGFESSIEYTQPSSFKDQLVESLRNYVANHEVVLKESRLNDTEFYYDNSSLSTPTEKIFFKWCRKLNLISLEPANNGDEYFGNLTEFNPNSIDSQYFPEILWKERSVIDHYIYSLYKNVSQDYLEIQFSSPTNFQVGDVIEINNLTNSSITSYNSTRGRVVSKTALTSSSNEIIVTDIGFTDLSTYDNEGICTLVYNRLVQYIGEVNGINNVKEASRSYTEVYAHIPDYTGKTPDILFRTSVDKNTSGLEVNYKPNLSFPILPSQYQPEILGAEIFSNPIVSNPNAYPGSYYGQFDTMDYTYTTSIGDSLRRSGDYFGIFGNINSFTVDSRSIDGVVVDFNTNHYVKMNILGKEISNFDQFNALSVNNNPPSDFEFNAILWYYTIEDNKGNRADNLYGISFVDNPDRNPIPSETGLRISAYRKLVSTNTQDGTSYAFSLNLNFNISSENPQDTYNPNAINDLFSFNLFNTAMSKLSAVNDSFLKIVSDQNSIKSDLVSIKQLIYSQSDINVINSRISNLDKLLNLYSSMQIISSESISVRTDVSTSPSSLVLSNIDPSYSQITYIRTSELYNASGKISNIVPVPTNKNFLIYVINDDLNSIILPNNDKLTILLNSDLNYKQSVDIIIDSNAEATQNKKLDIHINYKYGSDNSTLPVESALVNGIDLPIYYNTSTQSPNSAAYSSGLNFSIDLDKDFRLVSGSILETPIKAYSTLVSNFFKKGDTFKLNDFLVGTSSFIDFSGQYGVSSVGPTNSYIYLDISSNNELVNYGISYSLPITFNSTSSYILSNAPYLELNKGVKYKITRTSSSNFSQLSDRYLIEKSILN
jgi:hypothetical protein